ncbi:M20 family metallopeptidase [Pseudonocardia acaciae]|uniref:M20 family metallopeptidase n=1 Tax=Pseudonocardia acaciae TaxID=551276 RepID=UPI001FDEE821|nr:M20 family metallopeptidase [Pseudonocardia acaciae]
MRDWIAGHREQMLADLGDYVRRETPSTDKALLDAGLAWVEASLLAPLGAAERVARVEGGEHGDARVFDYPGRSGAAPVLALCHYDTVWPAGTLAELPFAVDGDRVTGPGVFDMKAGLVQLVWALRALDAAELPRPPVRLVLNGDEELGSPASRPVIESAARGARAALVFEASQAGAVKTARKGVGIFRVEARGVQAHAGLDPEGGVSAVDELARVVLALHALADLAAGTSVNVGIIGGGTARNVIAGHAHAEVDVRVSSAAEAARVDAALAALRPADPRAAITVTGGWNRPVMERGEGTAALFATAAEVAAGMGVTLEECSVGGASDGNFVAALGVPVLDGLGAVGDGAHARHEHISIAGMLERAALTAGLLTALAEVDTADTADTPSM